MDTVRLLFSTNKYELTSDHKREIDSLLAKKSQLTRLKIAGHTDNVGRESYNQQLSGKRASSVYDYLRKNGVDTAMLFVKFYGSSDPRVPNSNSENQAKNRRVDIVAAWIDTGSIGTPQAPPPPKEYHVTFTNGVHVSFVEGSFDKSKEAAIVASDASQLGGEPPVTIINNTVQMRTANMLTSTVTGEPLVCRLVACFNGLSGATQPVEIWIPVSGPTACAAEKFLMWEQSVGDDGKTRWKQLAKTVVVKTVNGKQYFVLPDVPTNGCINWDLKLSDYCEEVDSFNLEVRKNTKNSKLFTKVSFRKVELEDSVANILYEPIPEGSRCGIKVVKRTETSVRVTARLLDTKNRAYRFNALPLSAFQFDKERKTYFLTKKTLKAYRK